MMIKRSPRNNRGKLRKKMKKKYEKCNWKMGGKKKLVGQRVMKRNENESGDGGCE